jgi:hypothetical protein
MKDVRLSGTMKGMNSVTNLLNKLRGPIQSVPTSADVVIRHARPDEADALAQAEGQLAQLSSSRAPRGDVLVADVQGELWAAVSVDDGHAIANPFRPSGELTFRLSERARELHGAGRDRPRRPRGGRPRLARIAVA